MLRAFATTMAVLAVLAVLAALVMLGVSAGMNFVFLSSLGRGANEALILGVASVATDVLKAFLPLFIVRAWRDKRMVFVMLAIPVWISFVGFSLMSAIGFAAGNRMSVTSAQENLNAALLRVGTERTSLAVRIQELPKHRSVASINTEISAQELNPRWRATTMCRDVTQNQSRKFCTGYFALRSELANALDARRMRSRVRELNVAIIELEQRGAGRSADPQTALLAALFGMPLHSVRLFWIVVLAIIVELGSSLGLYFSTTHSQRKRRRAENSAPPSLGPSPKFDSAGPVEDFCLERLMPTSGTGVTLSALHAAYVAWCRDTGQQSISLQDFVEQFLGIAEYVGLTTDSAQVEGIAIASAKWLPSPDH